MSKKSVILLSLLLGSCVCYRRPNNNIDIVKLKPAITVHPKIESVDYQLGVIGAVEPVYVKDIAKPFPARIDTGAETCSIDAENVKEFERDGEEWVSFELRRKNTDEVYKFEKKITRRSTIKRQQGGDEKRITVELEISIGGSNFVKEFNLGNREKFEYQILIGRNLLNGLAVVDVALQNTLN